jgi:hypothetical protein
MTRRGVPNIGNIMFLNILITTCVSLVGEVTPSIHFETYGKGPDDSNFDDVFSINYY